MTDVARSIPEYVMPHSYEMIGMVVFANATLRGMLSSEIAAPVSPLMGRSGVAVSR